jgi:SAM-dependent methyltransferase
VRELWVSAGPLRRRHVYAAEMPAYQALSKRRLQITAVRCPGLGLTERRLCRAEQVDLYALRPRWHGCLRRPRSALPRARLCFRPARRARAVPLLGRSDSTAHQAEPGSSVFRGFDCPERGYPRLGRPCGPSHAIGCADPRRGVYSPGLAPAGGRARIRIVVLGESAKGPWGVMGIRFWRMADSRWWKDFDLVVAALQPAGSRVLDVGCGDGGLVDRLEQLGFDALGVDPAAPAHPRLVCGSVEQAAGLSKFDAVVAVMALHHAELDAVTSAIAGLLRPRGRLFVYDFDWSAYDDRAAAWLVPHDPSGADNSLAGWRREHGGLHRGTTMKEALGAEFAVSLAEVRRPYLARMLGRPDLEAAEHALIDAQLLPALGFWLIADKPD